MGADGVCAQEQSKAPDGRARDVEQGRQFTIGPAIRITGEIEPAQEELAFGEVLGGESGRGAPVDGVVLDKAQEGFAGLEPFAEATKLVELLVERVLCLASALHDPKQGQRPICLLERAQTLWKLGREPDFDEMVVGMLEEIDQSGKHGTGLLERKRTIYDVAVPCPLLWFVLLLQEDHDDAVVVYSARKQRGTRACEHRELQRCTRGGVLQQCSAG